MNYDYKKIGKRIKDCRRDCECNQTEFAEKFFTTQRTVSDWEGGKKLPSLDMLLMMCKEFNCELGYLLGEYDCKTRAATDICKETGLSEAAITRLSDYNKIRKKHPFKTVPAYMAIEFINMFILNCNSIINYIMQICEKRRDMKIIRNNPYYDIVKSAFDESMDSYDWALQGFSCAEDAFLDILKKKLCDAMEKEPTSNSIERFINKRNIQEIDDYVATYLPSAFDLLQGERSNPEEKMEMFWISDTFLDLVKAFAKQDENSDEDKYQRQLELLKKRDCNDEK